MLYVAFCRAEEDSKYAKLIAEREERKIVTNRVQGKSEDIHREQDEDWIGAAACDNSELDFDILDNEQNDIRKVYKSTNSSSSSGSCGIAVPSTSSACLRRSPGSSGSRKMQLRNSDSSFELSEEELRCIQQEKDEVIN
jgi:hypothetical protein